MKVLKNIARRECVQTQPKDDQTMKETPTHRRRAAASFNKPAASNARVGPWFALEDHWRRVANPEP